MNNDASYGILIVAVVVAIATLALVSLQSLGNTPVRDNHDLPPLPSGR
jgi:hypothetical protein